MNMRTSYVDRAWFGVWTASAVGPVKVPELATLRADMIRFMVENPKHPLSCTLSKDRRRWLPVAPIDREKHVAATLVGGDAIDGNPEDPYRLIVENRTAVGVSSPYKVIVGRESVIAYFAHIAGDVTVFSPFQCAVLGDVDELRPLRPDAGLPTVLKLFAQQIRPHGREWWRHASVDTDAGTADESSPAVVKPVPDDITATGVQLDKDTFSSFLAWRKATCPKISVTALMTTAAYLALTAEGLPINASGFNTILDLRRYLPREQALRPANLATGTFIKADVSNPVEVGANLAEVVESARAVPEALAGVVIAGLLRRTPPPAVPGPQVTMTFNSMPRNPGMENTPWLNENDGRYLGMTYPGRSDTISVFAMGAAGRMEFSASFNPNVLARGTVNRAFARLKDMPALLTPCLGAAGEEDRNAEPQQAPSM